MNDFDQLMQGMVDEPYENLKKMAIDAIGRLSKGLNATFRNTESSTTSRTILTLIGVCLGKDGKVTDLECRFVNDILDCNYDRETMMGVANLIGNEDGEQIILQLVKVLDQDSVAALVMLAACFCAVDETINRDETAFIRKLLNRS